MIRQQFVVRSFQPPVLQPALAVRPVRTRLRLLPLLPLRVLLLKLHRSEAPKFCCLAVAPFRLSLCAPPFHALRALLPTLASFLRLCRLPLQNDHHCQSRNLNTAEQKLVPCNSWCMVLLLYSCFSFFVTSSRWTSSPADVSASGIF
jgi:hypothetical protein